MAILLKNIYKAYGSHKIFENFSLEIGDGEMLAITGKSGRGKSTLLHMIGLLEPFQSGTLFLDDVKNPKMNSRQATLLRRNTIGYLFQNFALMENCTVEENLKWAMAYQRIKNKRKKMKEALEKTGLPADMLKRKVVELSGGEQQRVAIARLFLKPCSVVLADEPTGSLDEENRDRVIGLLQQLNTEGKTVVVVTHDSRVAAACPSVLAL